ncbi:ribosome biogenesis protein bop1-like isoform X1 [Pomacea canaliculata]|uniref:ribosome biogenesis protein bop1-like isoform X1 n=1 Tax=Pomacea canaliculata TaxID=400727 RepID=UPI000D728108|nr:ribosome biogenesis protein bop1-like isoform X1 [Pomacea canaliculata]
MNVSEEEKLHSSDNESDSESEGDLLSENESSSEDITESSSDSGSDSDTESESEDEENAPNGDIRQSGDAEKQEKPKDEYAEDSSDEEDIRNTVGNIPMEWYRDYAHLGYDVAGQKVAKGSKGDELDEFLDKMENPDYWRTVTDKLTGQKTVLSDDDIDLIKRIQKGCHPSSSENLHEPWIDFFSSETMIHPVTNRPADKRSFIPSKWEKLKVGQMVHAIKMGWMKPRQEKKVKEEQEFYNLWKDDEEPEITKRYRQHIPAPKEIPGGHAESYRPPPEYLFTKEEEEKWREQEPDERRINFIPQSFSSLRLLPAYDRFIKERFERCLDLYLCPRQRKMRMNVNPEDLIPKLPKPQDLRPFPTAEYLVFKGHTDIVRSISVHPSGQWLATGSDDGTVRFWEEITGRCWRKVDVGGKVSSVAWNPDPNLCLVAVAVNTSVILINPRLGDKLIVSNTDSSVLSFGQEEDNSTVAEKKLPVNWIPSDLNLNDYKAGILLRVEHNKEVSQVTWHAKGDYFATVMPQGGSMSVFIHQLTRRRTQNPFSKPKGLVQKVMFHPVRPYLFVATQKYVRVYNLLKQQLVKKLQTNCKWVSSMDVHPGGDNVIIGSYDCRLSWFDLDLSTKPYQTLRHHKKAIRQVTYHRRYPLFASASDDGTVIVCHGMVYSDLLQNPLIVPVKILRGHGTQKGLGVTDCQFHPLQPWLFSAGADGTVRLYR